MIHLVTDTIPRVTRSMMAAVKDSYELFKAKRKPYKSGERQISQVLSAGGAYAYPSGWSIEKLEQARHFRAWNYISIRAIAEEIARNFPQLGRPVDSSIVTKSMRRNMLNPRLRKKALAGLQQHEEIETINAHPLLDLMRNPNGPDVGYSFWYRLPLFMELTGECYWWKIRNRLGEVVEMWNLFPQWVVPKPGKNRLIDEFEVRPYGYGSTGVGLFTVPYDDMVCFKYPSPLSMINGHSPIQACSEWIDTSEAIDASRWYAFENGNHPGTIIELDEKVFGQKPVPTVDLNRFYAEYSARMGGREKARAPLVMNPGMKANPWNNTPAEMDYTESSNQNRDWVAAIHRVGKSIAGIMEDMNFSNSIAAVANFLQRTIAPKLTYYGQVITEQLAKEFDESLIVYWPDMTPDDPEQRNADIELRLKTGAITPNEVRMEFGQEPYEFGGDDPLVPTNVVPMPWGTGDMDAIKEWTQTDEETLAVTTDATTPEPPPEKPKSGKGVNRVAAILNGRHA